MHPDEILAAVCEGAAVSDAAIRAFVAGVVDGSLSRPQIAAWLAWAYARGLDGPATATLLEAMATTGERLAWPPGAPCVDKHSTGGVGDKTSLVLAPLWAAAGRRVPMISGRGLAHTGGTLDKLESIPGFRTDRDPDALGRQLEAVGCFIAAQTPALAPADRVLYALRDEIGAIASVPLIVASILSKKLAAGVEALVLDVKVGPGGFMPDLPSARGLADALVAAGSRAGMQVHALLTAMDRPLGRAVGNAVETAEAIACLRGEGPDDLRALVLALADLPEGARLLDGGAALARFQAMVEAQGGDPRVVDDPGRLAGDGVREAVVVAGRAGTVAQVDALAVGRAALRLGGGRQRAEDPVDPGVGVILEVTVGEPVVPGQPLARLLHRDGRGCEEATALVTGAVVLAEGPVEVSPLVLERRAHAAGRGADLL
ncbi:MAG: thymidine phosphorylase [Alphaproteobacteria bacterium]|nr:thymidine phosphorylase [Alphaproteobacteria bacterium]